MKIFVLDGMPEQQLRIESKMENWPKTIDNKYALITWDIYRLKGFNAAVVDWISQYPEVKVMGGELRIQETLRINEIPEVVSGIFFVCNDAIIPQVVFQIQHDFKFFCMGWNASQKTVAKNNHW